VSQVTASKFGFLTNHAQVLLCIASDPVIRLREIAAQVGITERAAHRIIGELEEAGYVTRRREGRRNRYTIEPHVPLPDPLARDRDVRDLLAIVGSASPLVSAGESNRRAR